MDEQKPEKKKSILASFADESASFEPWFKDPVKLVAAALNDDTDRRNALIGGLVDLAATDESFRRQMLSKFEALGQGKKARLSLPFARKMQVVYSVDLLRVGFKQQNRPHSITDVCAVIHHIFDISPKRLETLYYKLKKDPEVLNVLNNLFQNTQ